MNPTIEIAALLAQMQPSLGARIYRTLPVVGGTDPGSAWHSAARLIAEIEPDVVVALGESGKADRIHVEIRAVNIRDSRIPDNTGLQVRNLPVVEGAPAELHSNLHVRDLVAICESSGVAAKLSHNAGTFLCNELLFRLLDHVSQGKDSTMQGRTMRAGFIHVPQLPQQAKQRGGPSMDAQTSARGVHAILERVAIDCSQQLG